MRRLVLLAGALVLPLVPAAPAFAADNVLCVQTTDSSCTASFASITAAVAVANGNGEDDLILVGPGTYTEAPLNLNPGGQALVLRGAGQGVTTFTVAPGPSQTYIVANEGTVQDLTIKLSSTTSSGDIGLSMGGGSVDHVTVDGAGTESSTAMTTHNSTIEHSSFLNSVDAPSTTRGIFTEGGDTITDTVVTATEGISVSITTPAVTTVGRVTITAKTNGIAVDAGTVNVDDTVIDLGAFDNAVGLNASNTNPGTTPMVIDADHVTIVGGGFGSTGVFAGATSPTVSQSASVTLDSSIIRGPGLDLSVMAGNDGLPLATSTASIVATYTVWHSSQDSVGGGGAVTLNGSVGHLDVDPAFVAPAARNFRLRYDSPVVDQGNPAPGGPDTDRDGNARVFDGDAVAGAVRDLGAYEMVDVVAPDTAITSGPDGLTNDATATFAFTSEPGSTFQCRVDGGAPVTCSSPFTTAALTDGAHQFLVRATDPVGHIEDTPGVRGFTVDTVAPETTLTKKPKKRSRKATAKVAFASEAGATFQCRLDKGAWKACTSPYKAKVKVGKHTIEVRAVDAVGNVDQTPAKVRFKRLPKRPARY